MTLPWVERHRPRSLDRVGGHPQAVAQLRAWAHAWSEGHPQERAVLLHGPPGCGKTSAAHALAEEFGWEVVELNASDARSGPAIQRVAGIGSQHQTFGRDGEYRSTKEGRRKLIILDEADNLYERPGESTSESGEDLSDRGGKRAITETVAATQQPIVLIANDSYALLKGSERLQRSLLKIAFRRMAAPSVKRLLRDIADAEGVSVTEEALAALAARSQGDLRSAINDLEAAAVGRTRVESVSDLNLAERNHAESAFDAVAAILKGTDARAANQAARDLDETPDFLLTWIDENLPSEYRHPQDLARAYDALSRADVFLGRTMRRQQFGLWGYATELMAGGVCAAKTQRYGTPPHYQFPGWLRRMGQTKGVRGVRDSVGAKLGGHLHLGSKSVVVDVLPMVRAACQRDPELAEALSLRCDLDESEIRFLLGTEVSDAYADEVVAHVERRRAEGPTAQVRFPVHERTEPAPEPERASRHRGTRLGDF